VTFRERIRVNGEMISRTQLPTAWTMIRDLIADWDPHPTVFRSHNRARAKTFWRREDRLSRFLKPAWAADSMQPTLFNPLFQSLLDRLDHEEVAWKYSGPRSLVRKQNYPNQGLPVVSAPQQPQAEEVIRGASC